MPGAVVIGAGPGLGRAIAGRFARGGLPIALVARSAETLEPLADRVRDLGVPVITLAADATDDVGLVAALDTIMAELGPPDVVVYHAALVRPDRAGELGIREQLDAWAVNVGGALVTAARVAPVMARVGRGTFLITGGMPDPKPEYVSLSLGKAGVRTLVALLDLEYGPAGIHAASVTVTGPVAPDTAFDPDDIAEHYWDLHAQRPDEWASEVLH